MSILWSSNPHDRHVERAAAEIEDENRLILIELVQSVGKRRRRWLVDDLQYIQSRRAVRP